MIRYAHALINPRRACAESVAAYGGLSARLEVSYLCEGDVSTMSKRKLKLFVYSTVACTCIIVSFGTVLRLSDSSIQTAVDTDTGTKARASMRRKIMAIIACISYNHTVNM